jgi:caffeoyl-CoA O-methyltransferase
MPSRPAVVLLSLAVSWLLPPAASTQDPDGERDARVRKFLEGARGQWRDMNVPYADGQALYDLVTKRGFTRGLEIGTSTGHSAVWIAWAMSKTGGKLITIEIDERRHREAKANLEAAGVAPFVDARLADAHTLVEELPGPFDFVFSDADKDWYTKYFVALAPKLTVGGCFTAHNVLDGFEGVGEFLAHVRARKDFETEILRTSRSGISVSCKTR